MASFEGDENGGHRSDQTYISESAVKEAIASVLTMCNMSDDKGRIIFDSSYIAEVCSFLKMDAQNINNLSTVEELPILNTIENSSLNKRDPQEKQIQCQSPRKTVEKSPILNNIANSTVNKEVSEKMQIQLQPQWTHTGRENEGEINMEDSLYTDQVPSTSYQDLGAFNVPSNYATSSTSIGTTTVLQQSPAEETHSSSFTSTVCSTIERSKQSLKRHLAVYHGIGKYTCDVCERVFAYENELNLHISAYQLRNFSECNMCNMSQ